MKLDTSTAAFERWQANSGDVVWSIARLWQKRSEYWPAESTYTEHEYSLYERFKMVSRQDPGRLESYLKRDATWYKHSREEVVFTFVLSLPKPLVEILDELNIPRTYTTVHVNKCFGPAPEMVGPLVPEFEPTLRRVLPSVMQASKGFQRPSSPEYWEKVSKLLMDMTVVQPLSKPVPLLPVMPAVNIFEFPDCMGTLSKVMDNK